MSNIDFWEEENNIRFGTQASFEDPSQKNPCDRVHNLSVCFMPPQLSISDIWYQATIIILLRMQ